VGLGIALSAIVEDGMLGPLAMVGWWIPQMVLAFLMSKKRGMLRERLGGKNEQCAMDFLCWWWCGCCVAIQEARQVDEANSSRVECCCKILQASTPVVGAGQGGPTVVGQPVAVAAPIKTG